MLATEREQGPWVPRRLARLREGMETRGLEAVLISQPESRYYLSGYTGHDLPPRDSAGWLVITATSALLLTDARTSEQAHEESPDFEVVDYGASGRAAESLARTLSGLGVKTIGFEAVHLPYAIWRDLSGPLSLSGLAFEDCGDLVDNLRVVKDGLELSHLQAAIDVLDRCFAFIVQGLEPGLSERQVARRVEAYLIEHADGCSFPSIVAAGPSASVPHAVPGDRLIVEGEGLKIDIGAKAENYCSDMTRTVCLGKPRDSKLVEIFELVSEAQQAAFKGIRPGMTGRDVDELARSVIRQAGYGESFTHSTGHGIGLEVHEPPWISPLRGEEILMPGMVFSVEPGVYLPGWGGVRIEDLVVVEESGARVLSASPKTLTIDHS